MPCFDPDYSTETEFRRAEQQIKRLEAMLCAVLTAAAKGGVQAAIFHHYDAAVAGIPVMDVMDWWDKHREADRQRRETELERISPPAPTFLLYGYRFTLTSEVYASLLAVYPQAKDGYGSLPSAIERVEEFLSAHLPGVNHDNFTNRWNTLPRDLQLGMVSILHIAALSGLHTYPVRQHGKQ